MINPKGILKFLPTIGILLFIGIYIYASKLYPGGSQVDHNSIGFDWSNNYWCNLMLDDGLNGIKNKAQPVAITGIIILCSSMIIFFFQFANYFEKHRIWKITIKISGALAILSAPFIFSEFHDIMTTVLSVSGTVVIIGMIRALHNRQLTFLKVMGICCILVIALNNFFYYNEDLIKYGPLIQKSAFILILSWTMGLNFLMNRNNVPQQRV